MAIVELKGPCGLKPVDEADVPRYLAKGYELAHPPVEVKPAPIKEAPKKKKSFKKGK